MYLCKTDRATPSKFQSCGLTEIKQNAFLRSILLIKAPGPNVLIILYASSIVQYDSEYSAGSEVLKDDI